ncbi:LOW QUALITY PROTEIN: RNA binding motif protein 12Bb [Centropristis striata]|uniref:LOW QUALITY PROTEIN: RNA binding motif protein 12Bb n=1 Tax=Centropristis striata TaxID=184440 RepID=UPI0027E11F9A|nr:LOW QUALITY PROTEIN: RNA binding motif protein 12Bb [Centropristis striata]
MAVVIRLQGLRVTAGSEDIRKFFTGLKIPDGGVHIIGGDREEAFIIFASDEDARRAMTRSGGYIKGSPVTLLLSSKSEMQNMLERSTRNAELDQNRRLEETAKHARRSLDPEVGRRSGSRSDYTPPPQHQRGSNTNGDSVYVFLGGMPFSVTEADIHEFFSGLRINDMILLKNSHGQNNGKGLVKFATREDANEALERDRQYIGSRYVEVSKTTADYWRRTTGKGSADLNMDVNFERDRSPVRHQRNPHHARSQSPLTPQPSAPSDEEYCVFLDNLSYAFEKDHIKRLFRNAKLEDDQILHLLGTDGRRTRSAFVLFKNLRDYCDALTPEKRQFLNRWISTKPISREKMVTLLRAQSTDVRSPGNSEMFPERSPSYPPSDPYDSEEKTCLFVRNLPFDVRKVEIIDFFFGLNVTEDMVLVLRDNQGAGVGKALVLFRSEAEAMSALSLNGQRFLGSEVILKCISRSQMRQLGVEPPMVQEPIVQEPLPREERYSGRRSGASYPGDTDYPDFRIPRDGNIPMTNVQAPIHGGYDYEPRTVGPYAPQERGNGFCEGFGQPGRHLDGPTCVQLLNLPFQIRNEEIYDFCYGYRVIPGSVSLQYEPSGKPKGSATAMFESRQEALTAVQELSGRPIGPRKIQLLLV